MRALFYRLWGLLPTSLQELLMFLGSPRMTCGVAAIITDDQGRLLVLRHTYRRPAWSIPAGMIGRTEQPDAALARELREELAVEATIGPVVHIDRFPRRRHITIYYRATISGTPRHDVETDAHRYVDLDDLTTLIGTQPPWLRDLL